VEIEAAARLMNASEQDAFSVLGIQAERLELAETRISSGRPVPQWDSLESFDRVLSPQRAPADELARYATLGLDYARKIMDKVAPELRKVLCDGSKVRSEFTDAEKDVTGAIKYIASVVLGVLVAGLPSALAAGAAAIAATVAVILLKRKLGNFCATAASGQ
jgi:hypothetical protein